MNAKITIVVSMLLWLLSSFPLAARAEMDLGEAHEKMQQVMRDCETLSQNLKGMFDQLQKMEAAKNSPQQTAELQKHQEMMKQLLHEMTVHMEAEARMLEEMKAHGLWHDRHH